MFGQSGLRWRALVLSIVLTVCFSSLSFAKEKKEQPVAAGKPVTWRDPGEISARDLRYGPGSAELAPLAPFTFVKEIQTGESPKFKVRDARGVEWSVKMGEEAQAETVTTRLVWAMGYFADEAYYFDRIEVRNLPRLSRGQEFVEGKTAVHSVRMEPRRADVRRGTTWEWLENPFLGTRELNGLKVLMVLIGNYDTRVANNQIYTVKNPETGEVEARYVVADLGAALGRVGGLGGKRSKNSLEDFRTSKFVAGVENGMVNFDYNTKPKGAGGAFASIFKPSYRKSQANKEKAMRSVPVDDARWMGQMLSRLSDEQLRDAFRAANYDKATTEGFVTALRERINQLAQLPSAASIASGRNPER